MNDKDLERKRFDIDLLGHRTELRQDLSDTAFERSGFRKGQRVRIPMGYLLNEKPGYGTIDRAAVTEVNGHLLPAVVIFLESREMLTIPLDDLVFTNPSSHFKKPETEPDHVETQLRAAGFTPGQIVIIKNEGHDAKVKIKSGAEVQLRNRLIPGAIVKNHLGKTIKVLLFRLAMQNKGEDH